MDFSLVELMKSIIKLALVRFLPAVIFFMFGLV